MDLIGVLKPIIVTSQWFGCLLFKIKRQNNHLILVDSNSQYVYTIIIAGFKIGIQTSVLAYFVTYLYGDDTILRMIVSSIVSLAYVLIIISGVHTAIFSARKVNVIFNQLNDLQKSLFPSVEYKPIYFQKITQMVAILSFVRPILMYLMHMYKCSFKMSNLYIVIITTFVIDAFINQIMCNVVSFSMAMIGVIYQKMSYILQELKASDVKKDIKQFMLADVQLKDAADYFNKIYGVFNLITVFLCFLEIMYGLSFTVVFHEETYSWMWMTSYAIQLVQLTFACRFSSRQVRNKTYS